MDRFQDQVIFEGAVEFLQIPTRRPTKFVGTTPNIFGNEYWKADNNGTITNFTKGAEGQTLRILGDGLTTIANNTNIKTATAANELLSANVVYRFTLFDGVWYEDVIGSGGGGGVPIPLIVEGSVASDKIAYFHNTNAVSGYGVRIQSDGPVTNYALKISNAAGVGMFTAYGRTVLHLGPEGSTQINNILSGTTTNSFLSLEALTATDGQAGIIMKAASFNIVSMLYQTGGDGGMRLSWNYSEPYVAGNSYGNVNYPQIQTSWETDGAFGLEYTRPSTSSASTYDSLAGKSWKLYGAGNPAITTANLGRKDKYVLMTVGEPGRGFDLGIETAGTGSGYGTRIRIDDSTNSDPIYLWVAGALRQVKSFADGLGHNVLYY